MTPVAPVCRSIEPDLIAAATGDADPAAADRVRTHIDACRDCRGAFARYRAIDGLVVGLRDVPLPADELAAARENLRARLADLRSRILSYRIFASPLGPILIARSEQGVSLVEYLGRGGGIAASRLRRGVGDEAVEGGPEMDVLTRELRDYLGGRRRALSWPLDLRLAGSDFERAVLHATGAVPYGAVTSYARIAAEIGRPSATRAVARALKHNPLAIAVPCHRIVGAGGDLMGYVGRRISLKQQLLEVEGVPTVDGPGVRVAQRAMYVLYPGDDEYCVPTCPSLTAARMSVATLFSSRQGAEAAGVSPCSTCRPDLHPIRR